MRRMRGVCLVVPLCALLGSGLAGCGDGEGEPSEGAGGRAGAGGSSVTAGKGGGGGSPGRAGSSGQGGGKGGNDARGGSGGEGGASETGGSAGTGGKAGHAGSGGSKAGGGSVDDGPPAGNPDGECDVPAEAGLADVSEPDHVVGTGTPESCTGDAFVDAVAAGGVITFDCGDEPVTIELDATAKVFNDASDRIVIDGGGLVSLSGQGRTRILYMNTCDEAQHWTTDHCDNQPYPELTLQNLTFVDGNAKAEGEGQLGGGGAVWARGGRLKLVNTRFFNNVCADTGADVGGAAVRAFSQFEGRPVYVVNSTFGGAEGFGNSCSNGGGISSIGVSWSIFNSVFSYNRAVGDGGNPAQSGTPGGGSGGAIYNDGNTMMLSLCGSLLEHNQVNAYGSAIFFVSNDHSGTLSIHDSVVRNNSGGEWNVLPSISMHEDTMRDIQNSTIE